MAKLRREPNQTFADDRSLRLRAAWLYHAHGLTQNEVAERLGIGRSTVIRLLEEAKSRGEVQVWIDEGAPELIELGLTVQRTFGLDEVIVVPAADGVEETAKAVGLALGKFLSETIMDGMSVGVGWGRTLTASLASFRPPKRQGVRVMSLLGGAVEVLPVNPVEFSWRLAGALGAECYLFPAPLVVDSAETKRRLMEDCGLGRLVKLAAGLDLAVVSAGDIGSAATSLARQMISGPEHRELVVRGCVGDVMCNFLDGDGALVDHSVNTRVMSVGLEALRKARHVVLASGGAARARSIAAALKATGCRTLVTDEAAAQALLALREG